MPRPRLHDPGYLSFLRTQPCCICGRTGETEACHVKIGHFAMAKKPDDRLCVPMCAAHHREQHSMNEAEFYEQYGVQPFFLAHRLYWMDYGGEGGQPKKQKAVKPRKPKHLRQKIKSRGFTKSKRRVG